MLHPRVLDVIQALVGPDVLAMQSMLFLKPPGGSGQGSPDYATAAKWFGAAAEHGLADSQFNLAVLYENGLGVTKDAGVAYSWYAIAARAGDPEATKRRDRLLGSLDVGVLKSADDRVNGFRAKGQDTKINDARVAGDLWRNQQAAMQGQ